MKIGNPVTTETIQLVNLLLQRHYNW